MSTDFKKIAVVITGELRTWQTAKTYIFNFFDNFSDCVDYYFVTWNESSDYWYHPNKRLVSVTEEQITSSFSGRNLIQLRVEDILPHKNNKSIFVLKAHLSKIANVLKRRHEFNNNFVYDYVIEIRPDLFISPTTTKKAECKDFEIIIGQMFDDYFLGTNVPLLPDLYFRTTSLGHDIMSTRNVYEKSVTKFVDLRTRGFEFDPMISTRDVHFMLYDFICKRRMLPVYKLSNDIEKAIVVRPNVPPQVQTYEEIKKYYMEYEKSLNV